MNEKNYSTGQGQNDIQRTLYDKDKYGIPTPQATISRFRMNSQQQPLTTSPPYSTTYATQQGYFNRATNVPALAQPSSHSHPTTSAQQTQTRPIRQIAPAPYVAQQSQILVGPRQRGPLPPVSNQPVLSAAFYNQQMNLGLGQAQASLLQTPGPACAAPAAPGPTPLFNSNPPPAPPPARFHFDPAAVWPFQKAAAIIHDIHYTTPATGPITGRQLSEGLRNSIELLEHAIQQNEGGDRLRMLQDVLLQTMQKIVWYVNYHITLDEYYALLRSGGIWHFARERLPPYSPRR